MDRLRPSLLALLLLGGSGCGEDLNVGRADLDEGLDAATGADGETHADDDRLEDFALKVAGDWEFGPPPPLGPFLRLRLAPKPGSRSGEFALDCVAADWPCNNRPPPPDAGPWVDSIGAFLDRPMGTFWFLEVKGAGEIEGVLLASLGGGVKFTYNPLNDTLSPGITFTRSAANSHFKADAGAP